MEERALLQGEVQDHPPTEMSLILVSVGYRPTDTYLEERSIGQWMEACGLEF